MSLQSQLSGIDSRLSTLEIQKHSNDDITAVRTELAKICMYLFGYNHAPDVKRNKSNIKGVINMRNFSKVFLNTQERLDFNVTSMVKIKNKQKEYMNTVFYIPADAKMDGL